MQKTLFILLSGLVFSLAGWTKPQALYMLPLLTEDNTAGTAAVDTIKVIAVRIEFQPDTLSGTTGDGSFGSGIETGTQIDPLPHNRKYFQDQLLFLKNFYETNSNGSVILDISNAVYPLSDNSAYTVPYEMWHYNHNDSAYLDFGLSSLFYDAVKAADNGTIDFSGFDPDEDLFIIFHAGVGKDYAFDYDPTPFDIPSTYIELADLQEQLPDSVTASGIPVNGGSNYIKRGIILPECENQEGYELGMHGHMVLLFGHHIGIPSLYNTETGASATGWFGMMDQGSGKLDGLVPSPPDAWTKVFMGWKNPITVTSFPDTITIPYGDIYKVPITDKEYYLIENIDSFVRPGVSWDSIAYSFYKTYDDYPVTYDLLTDSVALYMNVDIDPVSGVLTDIGNWGIGRPASGILIWHIDENIIEDNIADNAINNDPDHLGVYIEEADGAMDIGNEYGWFDAGRGSELGSYWDSFWGKNEANWEANPQNNNHVIFGDNSFPDAKSNSGGFTHLLFHSFSDSVMDTMQFVVQYDNMRPGFPKSFDVWMQFPFSANIDGQPGDELFALYPSANLLNIYGWKSDGSVVPIAGNPPAQDYLLKVNGDNVSRPAVWDIDNDGIEEFAFATEDSIYLIDYSPDDSSLNIVKEPAPAVNYTIWAGPTMVNDSIIYISSIDSAYNFRSYYVNSTDIQFLWERWGEVECLLPDNSVVVKRWNGNQYEFSRIDHAGNSLWTLLIPSSQSVTAADIDRDGEMELIFSGGGEVPEGIIRIVSLDGEIENTFDNDFLNIVLCDPDNNGYIDFIGLHYTGVSPGNYSYDISAIDKNGLGIDYFPFNFDGYSIGRILAGKNPSGKIDIYNFNVPDSNTVRLLALDNAGNIHSGFPFVFSSQTFTDPVYAPGILLYNYKPDSTALVFVKHNMDTVNNIFDSEIYAINTASADVTWGSLWGNKRNTNTYAELFAPLSPAGSMMNENLVYNWPNPNNPGEYFTNFRYYLNYDADITITIYDMAGDKVDTLHDTGLGQAYNETVWDLTHIASGVYFAKVEAKGSAGTESKIVKAAVIK